MMRRSIATKGLGRSYSAERTLTSLLGLLALLAGLAALLVGVETFGDARAHRSVIDPVAVDWLTTYPIAARIIAIACGVLLLLAGLWQVWRALRPERRPDIELDRTTGRDLTVTSNAIAEALRADAETIDGVSRVRARAVGTTAKPALRLHIWLREGAELTPVWEQLDNRVLARARQSLNLEGLPIAVRLELAASERRRVQ